MTMSDDRTREKKQRVTYGANGDIWITKEEELVYTRDDNGGEDAEKPGSKSACGHVRVICVCDSGSYFGVGGFIF